MSKMTDIRFRLQIAGGNMRMIKRDVFEYFKKEPDVMQVKDVVRLLHCSKNTVYKLIHEGRIDSIKIGRNILIPKTALVEMMVNERYYQIIFPYNPDSLWTMKERSRIIASKTEAIQITERRQQSMAAIYKKELRSYFTSMTGYICMAFMLVVIGIYYAVINLPAVDGKRKTKWHTLNLEAKKGNKKEAQYRLNQILDKYNAGDVHLAETMTHADRERNRLANTKMLDYLDEWLDGHQHDIERETYHQYKRYIDGRIREFFTPLDLTVKDLSGDEINEFYTYLRNLQHIFSSLILT